METVNPPNITPPGVLYLGAGNGPQGGCYIRAGTLGAHVFPIKNRGGGVIFGRSKWVIFGGVIFGVFLKQKDCS